MQRAVIEVAISTFADALAARDGGADRLELCAGLEVGGLTPSLGALQVICEAVSLPVIGMVRPRAGGFVYSRAELVTMERDVELLLANGAAGVAVGVLTADRQVDVNAMRPLLKRVGAGGVAVFHRAFDLTVDPFEALEVLIDMGVGRILTSGQRATAWDGRELIKQLVERSAGRIEILLGGGVSPENALALLVESGAGQVHGSFSEEIRDGANVVCSDRWRATSERRVRATRAAVTLGRGIG
jgi:copper homeostasis protein